MAELITIRFFACQSWNATFSFFFFFLIRCGAGGWDFGSGSVLNLTVPLGRSGQTISGTGGFGLQFEIWCSVWCVCSCRRDPRHRCCWRLHTNCTFPVWPDETPAQVPADRALLLHFSRGTPPSTQPSSYPFLQSYSLIQISEHWALFNCFDL